MSTPRLVLGVLLLVIGAGIAALAGEHAAPRGMPAPATGFGKSAAGASGTPVTRGKPTGAVQLSVGASQLPEATGRFTVEVAVQALVSHEQLTLAGWGAEAVVLTGPAVRELGGGDEGRIETWTLSGYWTGQGAPRLYVRAEIGGPYRSGGRSLMVPVSQAPYRPASQGRLDGERGELVFESE